jgi:hypothetical protein
MKCPKCYKENIGKIVARSKKWQKEIKEEGWYWICSFIKPYREKNKIETSIYMDYVDKDDNGYFIENYYDDYCNRVYFDRYSKDDYLFIGPFKEPEPPIYKVKKIKGKWIADVEIEKEENIVNLEGEIPGTIDMVALAKELDKLDKEYQQGEKNKKIVKGKR